MMAHGGLLVWWVAMAVASSSSSSSPAATAASPLPETDWFSAAGHGVFSHYLNTLQNQFARNSLGKNSTWTECVDEFDADTYAADAAAAGAKYAFITVMQGSQFMIAPNSVFDRYTGYSPGEACARRDLVLDIWTALNRRGLALGLYFTGGGPRRDPKAARGMAVGPDSAGHAINLEFVRRWSAVLREYSIRYGKKVFGWWLDGCYYSAGNFGYNDTALKYYHDAIRDGNPDALIAFNAGVRPVIASGSSWFLPARTHQGGETTRWEDFTAGETNFFNAWDEDGLPTSRWAVGPSAEPAGRPAPFQKSQPLVTVQWHMLSFLGSEWGAAGHCTCTDGLHPNCSTSPNCAAYDAQKLKLYSQAVNSVGGVLTVDLQLLRNGSMNAEQVTTLREVWVDPWLCAADHANETCCCGQADECGPTHLGMGVGGSGVKTGLQCPEDAPVCSNFIYEREKRRIAQYGTCSAAANPPPTPAPPIVPRWQNASLPETNRLQDLLGSLTLPEKLTQLVHISPGIARIGLPAYTYSGTCNHGDSSAGQHHFVTVFPQSMALAESWDLQGIFEVGRATADEARADYNAGIRPGMHSWGPNVNVCRDSRWGRCQETSGEDPVLSARIAGVHTAALQNSPLDSRYAQVAVVCKHYDMYGGPEGVKDGERFRFKANTSERIWRTTHLPAFEACIQSGALGIMCSYSAVAFAGSHQDAVPSCANTKLLRQELRQRLGWQNHIVSDCMALQKEVSAQHWAPSTVYAAAASLNASTDLECDGTTEHPGKIYTANNLGAAISGGQINEAQIDEALMRVYRSRLRLGLLDPPGTNPFDRIDNKTVVDSSAHRALAIDMAARAIVMLKNVNETLPLVPADTSTAQRLCVFGPAAIITTYGNYAGVNPPQAVSYLLGLRRRFGHENVTYTNGCRAYEGACVLECSDVDPVVAPPLLAQCYASVVVLGTSGDKVPNQPAGCGCTAGNIARESEGCDRVDVALPGLRLLQAVVDANAKSANPGKVILFANNAGMVDLSWAKDSNHVDAILHGAYPGQAAGAGAAAVIAGDVSPAGRLSVTYYRYLNESVPAISNYTMFNRTYRFASNDVPVTYSFGFGLSFTRFTYSEATLSTPSIHGCENVTVNFTVTNIGATQSDEVAQLYVKVSGSSVPLPPRPELKHFIRTRNIAPREKRHVSLTLTPRELGILRDDDFALVMEPGVRTLFSGRWAAT